jgi:hypothetical protein
VQAESVVKCKRIVLLLASADVRTRGHELQKLVSAPVELSPARPTLQLSVTAQDAPISATVLRRPTNRRRARGEAGDVINARQGALLKNRHQRTKVTILSSLPSGRSKRRWWATETRTVFRAARY